MIAFAFASWLAYTTIIGIILFKALRSKRPALLSCMIILTVLTVFRPLLFFLGLDKPFPQNQFSEQEWALITQAILVLLFWLFLLVGFYNFFGPLSKIGVSFLPKGNVFSKFNAAPRGTALVVLTPSAFAILGTLMLIMAVGGVGAFMYAQKVSKDLAGLFIFKEATTLAAILALYGFLVHLKILPNGKIKLTPAAKLYLFIIVICMATNYLWGIRYNIALFLIAFGLAWHFYVKKINLLQVIVVTIFAFAILQLMRDLRGHLIASEINRQHQGLDTFWLELSASLHFVEFDALMLTLRDTGDLFEFRYGKDFLNGLLSWVPRSLYPEKESFHIGGWFRRIYEPEKKNGWPVTTIGGWYLNFGIFGILIGTAISGFIVRAFDEAFKNVSSNPWHASIGIGLCIFMLEGGVNTGFPQRIVLFVIPLALASYFLTIRNRTSNQVQMRPSPGRMVDST